MINLILSGGSGTRLWPLSRKKLPKQFIKFVGERSLFQETVLRNAPLCSRRLIVSGAEQSFLVKDDLEELHADPARFSFLFEPVGRNTAPAIALASLLCAPDDILLVTPSDHMIIGNSAYAEAVKLAGEEAAKGFIVTLGIKPTRPETGYGYIEADGICVKSFKEKPDLKTAEKYAADERYYWNSGIFCFKAGVMLDELKKHSPDVYAASKAALTGTGREITIDTDKMSAIPSLSIDYAVMEKSGIIRVIPAGFTWSDLGSFESLYDMLNKDTQGNASFPDESPKSIAINSENNLIIGSKRKIALIDVNGLVIADTSDALLISRQGSSQKVRAVVERLEEAPSTANLTDISDFARRTWGSFTVLEERSGYKVKQITVKPHKKLSLQKHFHRSEHWVVVRGEAIVTIGDSESVLKPNESTFIPQGELHRLENRGEEDLLVVEVQVGGYTGEDDIVRFSDNAKEEDP